MFSELLLHHEVCEGKSWDGETCGRKQQLFGFHGKSKICFTWGGRMISPAPPIGLIDLKLFLFYIPWNGIYLMFMPRLLAETHLDIQTLGIKAHAAGASWMSFYLFKKKINAFSFKIFYLKNKLLNYHCIRKKNEIT